MLAQKALQKSGKACLYHAFQDLGRQRQSTWSQTNVVKHTLEDWIVLFHCQQGNLDRAQHVMECLEDCGS